MSKLNKQKKYNKENTTIEINNESKGIIIDLNIIKNENNSLDSANDCDIIENNCSTKINQIVINKRTIEDLNFGEYKNFLRTGKMPK